MTRCRKKSIATSFAFYGVVDARPARPFNDVTDTLDTNLNRGRRGNSEPNIGLSPLPHYAQNGIAGLPTRPTRLPRRVPHQAVCWHMGQVIQS